MDKSLDKNVAQLESVLKQQLEQHGLLIAALERKRSALRAADARQVAEGTVTENHHVQMISELEKHRIALTAELTLQLNPRATAPMRLAELAEGLPEPAKTRVLVLRHQLRKAMERVQEEARVLKLATQAVLRHVTGMVQTIGAAATHTTTYGRQGARPRQVAAVSTFSMVA